MTPGNETHGGTDVALHAVGFGAERFHGFLTNTEVFGLLRDASKLGVVARLGKNLSR